MRTRNPHRRRYATLAVLLLLGLGIVAGGRFIGPGSGSGPSWPPYRLVETPIFSVLPRWALDRWATPITREDNVKVITNVLALFDPALRPLLSSAPIILDSAATTARAYPAKGYIGVSPDWDKTVQQSRYRAIYTARGMRPEEPVFADRFKTNLLIHEYLHLLQFHLGIDRRASYEAISRWYLDPRYGLPDPDGVVRGTPGQARSPVGLATNRLKYVLWHQLYNHQRLPKVPGDGSWRNLRYGARYRWAKRGVEEFAYLGEEILATGSDSENFITTGQWSADAWRDKEMRLLELAPEIVALYRGVFTPALNIQGYITPGD